MIFLECGIMSELLFPLNTAFQIVLNFFENFLITLKHFHSEILSNYTKKTKVPLSYIKLSQHN